MRNIKISNIEYRISNTNRNIEMSKFEMSIKIYEISIVYQLILLAVLLFYLTSTKYTAYSNLKYKTVRYIGESLRASRIMICIINTRITIPGLKKIQYITRARQGRNK